MNADDVASINPNAEIMSGTIGEITYLRGAQGLQVRGYGLVIDLPDTGGTNVRDFYQDYVGKEIRRSKSANPDEWPEASANDIIESKKTAVVRVDGIIPAGAVRRRCFDVHVTAVDQDSTSIAGGILLPCDLRIFNPETPRLEGKIHARAEGRIFVNPFVGRGSKTNINPRTGRIIAGGVNKTDRRLSLVTMYKSYSKVRQVQSVINQRFSSEMHDKVAVGVSATNIKLHVPEDYFGREMKFVNLVQHLPLSESRQRQETQATRLLGMLAQPNAPWEDVALVLEGLGKPVLAIIQEHYTDTRQHVNYYSGRVGLRLGDETAVEVVARHAKNPRSPFRRQAIRELGTCDMANSAGPVLQKLLTDENAEIRILAYESLRRVDPGAVRTIVVGSDPYNFILDVVPSEGPNMIYARKTRSRRLALIGGDSLLFSPPLLYSVEGKPVTLSAKQDADAVTILRKDHNGSILVGPCQVPLEVWRLVEFMGGSMETGYDRRLKGLGLDYAEVIELLYTLCREGAINADPRWEQPSVEELLGPITPLERPESDL
jgi:hypothetical protein